MCITAEVSLESSRCLFLMCISPQNPSFQHDSELIMGGYSMKRNIIISVFAASPVSLPLWGSGSGQVSVCWSCQRLEGCMCLSMLLHVKLQTYPNSFCVTYFYRYGSNESFFTHLSLRPHLCLSWLYCCASVGVGPLQDLAHYLGHPGTRFAADPLPVSSLQSVGEKLSPQHSPLLWGSTGSTGPAEPQTQPQSGFSYLLLFQLQNPLVWSSFCRLSPNYPLQDLCFTFLPRDPHF